MKVYPGDPAPSLTRISSIEKQGLNLTRIIIGSHTGTHIDAPLHFLPTGKGADRVDFRLYCGEAMVLDFSHKKLGSAIGSQDLEAVSDRIRANDIVLFYTGSSKSKADQKRFSYLAPSAAKWILEKHAKCVGTDSLSVEKFGSRTFETHKLLLSNGVGIIEGLNSSLKQLVGTRVFLITMPLKVEDCDGAPSRVVAMPLARSR
ncbi:MAG: cyclase family protein [Thaumarchaeota archaeon]|nr:cyclase family protein [Nitrososphaerota archaeon]